MKALSFYCVFLGFSLAGCGDSLLKSSFEDASKKQEAIDKLEISIWARSPTIDSGNSGITAESDLAAVPRADRKLTGLLDINGPLSGRDITVAQEIDNPVSVAFFEWAGEEVPWNTPQFNMFMGYHHTMVALNYAKELFASDTFDFRNSTNRLLPLKVYGHQRLVHELGNSEPATHEDGHGNTVEWVGEALNTQYDFVGKQLLFYGQFGNTLKNFNPIQEADAIYHEFGHVVQHMVNKAVLESGGNPDMDAILEGLADYYSAAVLNDDNILSYLASNSSYLFGSQNTNGPTHIRQINHSLSLKTSYTTSIHLNGRVIAGALNEFRKYLDSLGFSTATSFSNTAHLAYIALSEMSSTSTFRSYADRLVAKCSLESWCSPHASHLSSIMVARGLSFSTASPGEAPTITNNSTTLGFLAFPGDSRFANTNSTLDACEVAMIFPNISGTAGLSIINGRLIDYRSGTPTYVTAGVKLSSYSGLTHFDYPNTTQHVEYLSPTADDYEFKSIPWLEPGDILQTLIRNSNSKIYTSRQGSVFTKWLSVDFFPSPLGWLVRAGSSGTASATFEISIRAVNNSSLSAAMYRNETKTYTIPITPTASGATNYCNNL